MPDEIQNNAYMSEELLNGCLPGLNEKQRRAFCLYFEMLTDWNQRINLTRITSPAEVAAKHFADSVLPAELIPPNARLIDVGTGAGFPGIPLKLVRPDIRLTLLDSLNKRVEFLRAVCEQTGIQAECIHARAEDAARGRLRGGFDIATARAVAAAPVLMEYLTPFLRKGGLALLYKGPQASEELAASRAALKTLNCAAELKSYTAEWGERNIIIVRKTGDTPRVYPRKAGTAEKKPL